MIRKFGKARWTYTCRACDYTSSVSVDQFGAIEACQRHERSFEHLGQAFNTAMQIVVDAFTDIVKPVVKLIESFGSLTMPPPPNRPHDPTLLHDRRKWGGR